MQNFRGLGAPPPDPQNSPPPIANFWLRAWLRQHYTVAAARAALLRRQGCPKIFKNSVQEAGIRNISNIFVALFV